MIAAFPRLADKISPEPMSGCRLWDSATSPTGYGLFWFNRTYVLAHRFVYTLLVGAIPEGLTLDHRCRTRCCVNPDHLEPVSGRENILRGVSPSARNARKTHCKRGHRLAGDNLKVKLRTYPDGVRPQRTCRTCESAVRHLLYLRTGR
jgi:hypothetical protein